MYVSPILATEVTEFTELVLCVLGVSVAS